MKKNKPNIASIAKSFSAAKEMFDKKLFVFEINQVKMYSVLVENKDKKFKKNYFKNVYTYCVWKGWIKINNELFFVDIETEKPIASFDGKDCKFIES